MCFITIAHMWIFKSGTALQVSLEKEMEAHSSILAWRIPWMEEPGGLQSMGSQRVGHDWLTLSLSHTTSKWREANLLNSGDLWRTQAGDGQPARYGFSRVPSPESRSDALTGPYAASETAAAFGDGGGGLFIKFSKKVYPILKIYRLPSAESVFLYHYPAIFLPLLVAVFVWAQQ